MFQRTAHLAAFFLLLQLGASNVACASSAEALRKVQSQSQSSRVHHVLSVRLEPTRHELTVTDEIQFPAVGRRYHFSLHAGLNPKVVAGGQLAFIRQRELGEFVVDDYSLQLAPGIGRAEIQYSGSIYHPLREPTSEAERGITETPGLISEEGAALFGETHWYPHIQETEFLTFELQADLPAQWNVVSQGARIQNEVRPSQSNPRRLIKWSSPEPQQEIHFHAAEFHETNGRVGPIETMVFLRTPETALSNRYLEATTRYLEMYLQLLGEYPYSKFALVENFWDTGYGMPSFTLIGSNVLRLPFIINSSYPHEILHDWWGNGVYVDATQGNWCEGLTSYLADHLLAEQSGQGTHYRREALDQFTSGVTDTTDFPLAKFLYRFDLVTSSVGYGKAMMFFHMLRLRMGDAAFTLGLRKFYQDFRFQRAGYGEIRHAFESVVPGFDLGDEFSQWVTRAGAPELAIRAAFVQPTVGGSRVKLRLAQTQTAWPVYTLRIPIAIHWQGTSSGSQVAAYQTTVTMSAAHGREQEWTLDVPGVAHRIEVDPEFDVFRRLSPGEVPPSFVRAYGSSRTIVILPTQASSQAQLGYQKMAELVERNQSGHFETIKDDQIMSLSELPADATVWVMGWDNRFASEMSASLRDYGVDAGVDASTPTVVLDGQSLVKTEHGFAFALPSKSKAAQTWVWLTMDSPTGEAAAASLGAKLPHYGKFGYVAFEFLKQNQRVTATKRANGQWPSLHSPLSMALREETGSVPSEARRGSLQARPALVAP